MDQPLREPDEIRRDCAQKLGTVETGGMFSAILGCVLRQDWSSPRIEELRLTPDRCLLGRLEGEAAFKALQRAEAGVMRPSILA